MPDDKKPITQNVNNSFWFERIHNNGADTYASGEIVGTLGELNVRGQGGGGVIRRFLVGNNESQSFPMRIHFFRREPSEFEDTDTYAPVWPNDFLKYAGWEDVAAGNYESYGTVRIAQLKAVNVDFSCPVNGRLYYYVEARGAGTFAAANAIGLLFGDWPD